MQTTKNKILLCIIVVLLFLYFCMTQYFHIEYGLFPLLILGGALLFLGAVKKKIWAFLCGAILMLFCCGDVFHIMPKLDSGSVGALVFILIGIFLLQHYYRYKNKFYIVPACFMLWAGIYIILCHFSFMSSIACAMLFICIGLAFVTAYYTGSKNMGIWTIAVSQVLFIMGFLLMHGNPVIIMPVYIGCVILILWTVVLFAKNRKY